MILSELDIKASKLVRSAALNQIVALNDVDDYWAAVVFKYEPDLGYTYMARSKDKKHWVFSVKRAEIPQKVKFYPTLEAAQKSFVKRLKPIVTKG